MPDLRRTPLAAVRAVSPVLTNAVQLRRSLWTVDREAHADHLDAYVPTQSAREALLGVLRGTSAASHARKRVHFLTGSYGTGKSYLLLVLASLLGLRLDDPRLERLLGRIRKGEDAYGDGLAAEIETARKLETPERPAYGYLIVVPDYADREYDRALLTGLREALDAADLDVPLKTEFDEAERVLAGWRAERPDFVAQLDARLAPEGGSAERMLAGLRALDGDALARFARLFEAVTGAPYRAARVSLTDTFDQAVRAVRGAGYRGVAVLFDEFGFFLEEAGSGRAGTAVAAVQDLMEFARGRADADVQLVLAAHRALADYGAGEDGQAEMRKMEGRLEATYRLRPSAEHREAEEMMAGAFVPPPDADGTALAATLARLRETADREGWTNKAARWYGDDAEWTQATVVEGTYPLHPTATLALPGLSDDVGQNTRTMFRFLAPGEPGGADAFIQRSAVEGNDGRLAVLTLADLFDYFVAPAEGAAGRAAAVREAYRDARHQLRTPDPLADRLLKTVAVVGLLRDPRLQATAQTLRWAVDADPDDATDVGALLDVLVAQGALRQNQNTRIYSFRSAGGTSTDALFAEKKREVGVLAPDALLETLRAARPPQPYSPIAYNDRLKTNRRVAADYVAPGAEGAVVAAWRERFGRLYGRGDAKGYEGNLVVLYGLYEDEADRARLEAALREATRATPFVAALAAAPTALADLAANVAAAGRMLEDPKVRADENALDESALRAQEYLSALAGALDRALDPARFAWYAGGERRHEPDALSKRKLSRFLDDAVEAAFPDTPLVVYDLVQEYPSTNSTNRRRRREEAVSRMLQPTPFSIEGTSEADEVLKGLLRPNGMFEVQAVKGNEEVGVVVAPRADAPAAPAWHALEDALLAAKTPRRERKVAEVLPVLYRPPFGVSAPAAEVLLGAFVAVHREGFELRDPSGRQEPLSGEALLQACASTRAYKLVHQAITPAERAVLDRVGAVLDKRRLPEVERSFGPWADPAARLADWYAGLPNLTKKRAPDDLGDDIRTLFDALAGYRGSRDDEAARALLTDALPAAFGAAILDDPAALDGFARRLGAAVQAAGAFADYYAEAVLKDVADRALGEAASGSAEFEAAVVRWRDALSPAAKQHAYDGPADALVQTLTRASSATVVERFLTALPQAWSLAPFRAWTTKKQRADYVDAFRDAVREVREWQSNPLPLLRRLHREAFGDGVPELTTADGVDAAFQTWLAELPDATFARLEAGGLGPEATALFAAVRGTGTPEDRYLGTLASAFPQAVGPWTTWSPVAQNVVVLGAADAVRQVSTWTPPLSAEDTAAAVLDGLGWPVADGVAASDALDAAAAAWYDGLAPAARRHTFGGLADAVLARLREQDGLAGGLAEGLPRAAGRPPLHQAEGADAARALAGDLAGTIARVSGWRRPVLDALRAVDGTLADASALTLRLGAWVRALRPTPTPEGLGPAAAALLAWSQAGTAWEPAFGAFAEAAGLDPDVHAWTPADDGAFAAAFADAQAEAEAWTPPPVDPDALRDAVADALRGVLRATGATPAEVQAVLFQAASDLSP